MPTHDLLIQTVQQVAAIGALVTGVTLTFGLTLVGILAARLHREEQLHL